MCQRPDSSTHSRSPPAGTKKRPAHEVHGALNCCSVRGRLLQVDGPAGLLEVGLELLGLGLVDALLDGLGRLVDERLGLLEAQAGGRADDLEDLDLLVAGRGEDDVEGRLLLLGLAASVAAAAARR